MDVARFEVVVKGVVFDSKGFDERAKGKPIVKIEGFEAVTSADFFLDEVVEHVKSGLKPL